MHTQKTSACVQTKELRVNILYLALNTKMLGIFGHGWCPLPFCLIDSHNPKISVSEVPVNCYSFSFGILSRRSFGSGFHVFIAVSNSGEDYCTFPVLEVEKKTFTGVVAGLQITWK